jgi:hypothetical protein
MVVGRVQAHGSDWGNVDMLYLLCFERSFDSCGGRS